MEQYSGKPLEATYNQAAYQQLRINNIISRIDSCYTNPLQYNILYQSYNYNIIINDLISVFMAVSAKMTDKEKEGMVALKEDIEKTMLSNPIHKKYNINGKRGTATSIANWNIINEKLFKFRMDLEVLMDAHGYGNPSKDDPRMSVLNG